MCVSEGGERRANPDADASLKGGLAEPDLDISHCRIGTDRSADTSLHGVYTCHGITSKAFTTICAQYKKV